MQQKFNKVDNKELLLDNLLININEMDKLSKPKHATAEAKPISLKLQSTVKNILQSNANKEVTKKSYACKDIKIVKILNKVEIKACKNIKKNYHEDKEVKNNKNVDIIPDFCKHFINTSLTIKKVNPKTELTDPLCINLNTYQNQIENYFEETRDKIDDTTIDAIFPDFEKLIETINATLPNNTHEGTRADVNNVLFNTADTIHSNCAEIQNVNDQTTKCLREFDKVLEEVQCNIDPEGDAEAISLEGIDDLFNDSELNIANNILNDEIDVDDIFIEHLDMDSTYNFQEIKNVDNKDFIVTGNTSQAFMLDKISASEDNIDVISISSDDSLMLVENNTTTLEAIKENITNKCLKDISVVEDSELLLQINKAEAKIFVETKSNSVTENSQETEVFVSAKSSETNKLHKISILSNGDAKIFKSNKEIEISKLKDCAHNTEQTKNFKETKSFDEPENPKNTESVDMDPSTVISNHITGIKNYEEIINPEANSFNGIVCIEKIKNPEDPKSAEKIKSSPKLTKQPEETRSFEEIDRSEDLKSFDTTIKLESSTSNPALGTASSNEDFETISINSDTYSSDCGYHSSDFEFITETEAKHDGFIINYNLDSQYFNSTAYRTKVNLNSASTSRAQYVPYGAGPSRSSGNNCYVAKEELADESYKEDYKVPQENQVVDMFRAMPAMPRCELQFLENKSLHTRAPMLVQYEGVGFDLTLAMHQDTQDEDDEYRDEARESLNKIYEMYPVENASRRQSAWRRP